MTTHHNSKLRLAVASATLAVAAPVLITGVLGTFLTAGAVAAIAHWGVGFGWWIALLIGTAVAPTDPAVVFSVLGQREISGPSGTMCNVTSGASARTRAIRPGTSKVQK